MVPRRVLPWVPSQGGWADCGDVVAFERYVVESGMFHRVVSDLGITILGNYKIAEHEHTRIMGEACIIITFDELDDAVLC